tara:strand:+ start:24 stop:656 length:633 start_codon:yes stop_codon:yes gene_type:complete
MGIRVMNAAEKAARDKPFNDMNTAYRMGFNRQDLPKDRYGNLPMGYATPGMRQSSKGIQKSADFLLGKGGKAIQAREKANFANLRSKLAEDRLNDPQRTKTYTVRQGGADGTTKTFRSPVTYDTAGQEILSNLTAAQRGTGMSSSSTLGGMSAADAMSNYGKRSVLIGEAQGRSAPQTLSNGVRISRGPTVPNVTSLNPESNMDFSRKLI